MNWFLGDRIELNISEDAALVVTVIQPEIDDGNFGCVYKRF